MQEAQLGEIINIANYLESEKLLKIEHKASGGIPNVVRITHAGIKEIEKALRSPDQSTEHFMPIMILKIL